MRSEDPQLVRLADYKPSDFLIDRVNLDIKLDVKATRIKSRLSLLPNPAGRSGVPLVLDGDELVLLGVTFNGQPLEPSKYEIARDKLTLTEPPQAAFELEIETELDPSANTKLMGLYRSGSAYCTQCEAEGFRRITYYIDRPDNLAVFTTRIEADKAQSQARHDLRMRTKIIEQPNQLQLGRRALTHLGHPAGLHPRHNHQ